MKLHYSPVGKSLTIAHPPVDLDCPWAVIGADASLWQQWDGSLFTLTSAERLDLSAAIGALRAALYVRFSHTGFRPWQTQLGPTADLPRSGR